MGILFAATLVGCSHSGAAQPQGDATRSRSAVHRPAVSVQFATVTRDPISATTKVSGTVIGAADAQAALSFPAPGQIAEVYVDVGDHVRAGDTLAAIDVRTQQREVQQAQADVMAAQAALTRAQAGARPQEVAGNAALVQGLRARADTARAELSRQESLATVGIASRRDVDQARAAYAEALANLRSKQQEGSLLKSGPRPQDVEVARAQMQQATAALATARTRLSLTTIVAPFDGVVTARTKNAGEVVDAATPVLTIVDPRRSLVEIHLSEDQAATVHSGDSAFITVSNSTRPIAGRVETVNAAFSPDTRTLTARIRPIGAALIPGASAQAEIAIKSSGDAFTVPESAVVKDPQTGEPLVFVPTGHGTYTRVSVQIVVQNGSRIAVKSSALHVGQRVVSRGAYELLPFAAGSETD